MGIDGIIDRIRRDAAAEAEAIKQRYLSEVERLEREFEEKSRAALEDGRRRAENEKARAKARAIEHAKLVLSQKVLAKKLELLEKIYSAVKERIENLPHKEYKKLFATVLAKLGERRGKIVVAADADVLDEEFVRLAVEKLGEGCEFELERTSDEDFRGFILVRDKIRYNVTLDALLEDVRERTEEEVIKRLFG